MHRLCPENIQGATVGIAPEEGNQKSVEAAEMETDLHHVTSETGFELNFYNMHTYTELTHLSILDAVGTLDIRGAQCYLLTWL